MAQDVSHIFQDPAFRKKYYKVIRPKSGEKAWIFDGIRQVAQAHGFVGNEIVRLELPTEENDYTAVVVEVVRMLEDGEVRTYTGVGDANPKNCNKQTVNALIRMADTRALSRAFRNALMIDEPVYVDGDIYEEDGYEEEPEEEEEAYEAPRRAAAKAKVVAKKKVQDDDDDSWEDVEDLESYFSDDDDDEPGDAEDEEESADEEQGVDDLVDTINEYISSGVISLEKASRLSKKITGHANPRNASRERVEALLEEIERRARNGRG